MYFCRNPYAQEELHWLALKMVPGLGTRTAARLLQRARTPQAVLRASRSELEAQGVAGSVAQSISSGCSFEDAVIQQRKMRETDAHLIALSDPRYPERLKEIFDPPLTLFARGRLSCWLPSCSASSARAGRRPMDWRSRSASAETWRAPV